MKNKNETEIGVVKHVGKTNSKKKNVCWIEVDGNLKEIDFLQNVATWK